PRASPPAAPPPPLPPPPGAVQEGASATANESPNQKSEPRQTPMARPCSRPADAPSNYPLLKRLDRRTRKKTTMDATVSSTSGVASTGSHCKKMIFPMLGSSGGRNVTSTPSLTSERTRVASGLGPVASNLAPLPEYVPLYPVPLISSAATLCALTSA